MPSIIPVPTTRVSDALVTRRLLTELQFNERELLRVQTQVSTGRRYAVASENPPSALRAIGLQRLVEQKQQIQQNIDTGQSYLSATDSSLVNIGQLLAEIRGLAVTAANVTSTNVERQAAKAHVNRALDQLVQLGNQRFRGRFLFSGSQTTVRPYEIRNGLVQYNGNDRLLYSLSDLDALFQTSLSGDEVFGGTSPEVQGTADLTPRLSTETRLADLRGGQGISPGSIDISDGTTTSTIDVDNAETVGDLIRLLEANPPEGRVLSVDITATGLVLSIDTEGGGNLTVREVGGGLTAAELGILSTGGTGTAPIVGEDLNPQLTLTTRLDDILGVRAQATLSSDGTDNDVIVQARNRGPEFNDIGIRLPGP